MRALKTDREEARGQRRSREPNQEPGREAQARGHRPQKGLGPRDNKNRITMERIAIQRSQNTRLAT